MLGCSVVDFVSLGMDKDCKYDIYLYSFSMPSETKSSTEQPNTHEKHNAKSINARDFKLKFSISTSGIQNGNFIFFATFQALHHQI